jgi:hypothetical protein
MFPPVLQPHLFVLIVMRTMWSNSLHPDQFYSKTGPRQIEQRKKTTRKKLKIEINKKVKPKDNIGYNSHPPNPEQFHVRSDLDRKKTARTPLRHEGKQKIKIKIKKP